MLSVASLSPLLPFRSQIRRGPFIRGLSSSLRDLLSRGEAVSLQVKVQEGEVSVCVETEVEAGDSGGVKELEGAGVTVEGRLNATLKD